MDLQSKIKNFLSSAGQTVSNYFHPVEQAVGNEINQLPQQAAGFGQTLANAIPNLSTGINFLPSQQQVNFVQQSAQPVANFVQQAAQPVGNFFMGGEQNIARLNAKYNPFDSLYGSPDQSVLNTTPTGKQLPDITKKNYNPTQDIQGAAQGLLGEVGLVTAPVTAGVSGLVNAGFQAGSNLINGKPLTNNLAQATGQGINFGATVAPISKAVSSLPLLSDISSSAQNLVKPTLLKNAVGSLARNVPEQTITGGIYGAATGQNPLSTAAQFAPFGLLPAAKELNPAATTQALKDVSPNAFKMDIEDQKVMQDIIYRNQTSPDPLSRKDNQEIQNMAEQYLGKKWQMQPTNKILQAFDYVLASQNGGVHNTPFPKMSLAGSNQSDNAAAQAIMQKFQKVGLSGLTPQEKDFVMHNMSIEDVRDAGHGVAPGTSKQIDQTLLKNGQLPSSGLVSDSAKAKLDNLINYPQRLNEMGYSSDQINRISAPEAQRIIDQNIPPFAHETYVPPQPAKQPLTTDNIISKKPPIGKPSPKVGVGTADDALAAQFAARQNIDQEANVLKQLVTNGVKNKEETALFRNSIEHPDQLEANAAQVKNPEAFKKAVAAFQKFTDTTFELGKKSGLDLNYLPEYYSHIIDFSDPKDIERFQQYLKNAGNATGYFEKSRVFKNIDELQAAGFKLKNPTVPLDVEHYTNAAKRAIGSSALFEGLNKAFPDEVANINQKGGIPIDETGKPFKQLRIPGLEGTAVSDRVYKQISHLEPSAFKDNPIINAIDKANTLGKNIQLAGGGFHALKETLNYAGNELANIRFPNLAKATQIFFSPNAMLKYKQDAIDSGLVNKASQMGVTIGKLADLGDFADSTTKKITSKNPFNALHNATFDRLINYYKLETVKNTNVDGLSPEQQRKVGEQINNLFGGMNLDLLHRNKTTQQLLRFAFLAPDFNEGKIRTVAGAFTVGQAGSFARKALVGQVLATALTVEIANKLATGKFVDLQNTLNQTVLNPNVSLPSQFDNNGKKQALGLPGSNIADVARSGLGSLVKTGIDAATGKSDQVSADLSQAGTDFGHFLTARGSSGISDVTKMATGKDYYGNSLVDQFREPDNLVNRAKGLALSNLPIPVVQGQKVLAGKENPKDAVLNTVGFRVHNDPNDPNTVAQQKYFSELQKTSDSLNPNDRQIFNGVLHPQTKDSQGNPVVDKNQLTSPDKYETLLAHPNILQAEQKFQQSQPNHDPLWDLSPDQLRAYMQATVISKNDPGGDKNTTNTLYSTIPQSFYTARTAFFNSLPPSTQTGNQLPQAPAMPQDIQAFWQQEKALPTGTGARTRLLQTPEGQKALAFMQQQQMFTNAQRADLGLPLLNSSTSGSSGSGGYSSGSRGNFRPYAAVGFGLKANSKGRIMNPVKFTRNKSVKFASPTAIKQPKTITKSMKPLAVKLPKPKISPVKSLAKGGKPFKLKLS